jgi:stearoyl-CoA desaturase (delta-9 desaturase)
MCSIPITLVLSYYTSWWFLLASLAWSTVLNTVFVQIGLHRYFAHSGFLTGFKRHCFLSIGSVLAGAGSPISWSTHHLHHHRHSDQPEDLHSPRHGWFHSAFAWPARTQAYFGESKGVTICPKVLVKDSVVLWTHKNYFNIWLGVILVTACINWQLLFFAVLFPAAGSLLRGNVITNFLSHTKLPGSYQNFNNGDCSYNNKIIQFFQIGEGLHNNHHHNMRSYNQAMQPNEHDPAAWIIDKFFKI